MWCRVNGTFRAAISIWGVQMLFYLCHLSSLENTFKMSITINATWRHLIAYVLWDMLLLSNLYKPRGLRNPLLDVMNLRMKSVHDYIVKFDIVQLKPKSVPKGASRCPYWIKIGLNMCICHTLMCVYVVSLPATRRRTATTGQMSCLTFRPCKMTRNWAWGRNAKWPPPKVSVAQWACNIRELTRTCVGKCTIFVY